MNWYKQSGRKRATYRIPQIAKSDYSDHTHTKTVRRMNWYNTTLRKEACYILHSQITKSGYRVTTHIPRP